MPANVDYQISAFNDVNPLNGVSTLDLVLIQRHILGLKDLDSPYKLVAADINNDKNVKASDLTELRKLILGIDSEFEHNKSWQFIDATQEFDMDMNLEDVNYTLDIMNLEGNITNNDLIAVKIGDVTDNASTNLKQTVVSETRSQQMVEFVYANQNVEEEEVFDLDISINESIEFFGCQFTLNLNGLEFLEIEGGALEINESSVGVHENASLTVSYNYPEAQLIDKDEVLFTLRLKALKEGDLKERLKLNSKITPIEIYYVDQRGQIQSGDISLNFANENYVFENRLYQNYPNPFTQKTTIAFDLMYDEEVVIMKIYDMMGREVYKTTRKGKKGRNEIEIDSRELLFEKGILIYKIESKDFIDSKKMTWIK